MKRIIISQRRDHIDNRDETRDCLDVRWAKILYNLNFLPLPVCSELSGESDYISRLMPDGILLTGGNDLGASKKRDELETNLLEYAISHNIPVIGVCRGMQFLNHYCGGSLVNVSGHVATYVELTGIWAKELGYNQVNSFHNQAITEQSLGQSLKAIASTQDGVIKAVKHHNLPWLGVMWHPEREKSLDKADAKLLSTHFNR